MPNTNYPNSARVLHVQDPKSWSDRIWEVLHCYRENSIPEGVDNNDEEWSEICTAMAWIDEELDTYPMTNDATRAPRSPGQLSPIATKMFSLAKQIAEFGNEHTERLNFDDYSTLCEHETKLLAYANLLAAFNSDAFLESEITEAEEWLSWIQQRIQVGPE